MPALPYLPSSQLVDCVDASRGFSSRDECGPGFSSEALQYVQQQGQSTGAAAGTLLAPGTRVIAARRRPMHAGALAG